MKKKFAYSFGIALIALSLSFASCTGGGGLAQPPSTVIVNQAEYTTEAIAAARMNSVVAINASFVFGGSAATGFVINENGYILTNRHAVVSDSGLKAGTIKCAFSGSSQSYSATIVVADKTYDLAVIKLETALPANAEYNVFETALPAPGAYCATIGNAQGRGLSVRDGVIGSNNVETFPLTPVLLSMAINHGNSGGPVYDKYGNVTGIVCSREKSSASDPVFDMGYAIGSQTIVNFLKANGIAYHVAAQ